MTNIHIITPIVTDGFRNNEPLLAAVPAGCNVEIRSLENGPASVESAVDEVLAAPGVVDAALRAENEGANAVVIDCMLDPGLDAAREAVGIPVIGCGEAALKAAAAHGAFSIITVLQRQERAFRELCARYLISDSLRSVRGIGVSVLDLERDTAHAIDLTTEQVREASRTDGAQAIVYGCTGMLGFAKPAAEALGWPVERIIDPLPFAVVRAHESVLAGVSTDKDIFQAPEPKLVRGFERWPALEKMMAGKP